MEDDPKQPPDGGGTVERKSYASVLGSSLKPKSDKNLLEVVLEKETRGAFVVKELECANMMRRMGLDQRPGVEVEEVQICLHSSWQRSYFHHLEERSIRSVMVKPAG